MLIRQTNNSRVMQCVQRLARVSFLLGILAAPNFALAQAAAAASQAERPTPPARDPHSAGYVSAKELSDGTIPPADADGNFIIGPTHNPAEEMSVADRPLKGKIVEFTMNSADSKYYPGIARDAGTFGTPDPPILQS